ncbi:MAG: 16S rRNA (guanine(527)-N(7))-methyltransferase RsmG [Firmicutes bacterium]|nr:16S rRNA (guanine(527)-N(7))-methyltransferase RsmG [Bacillota bacterium]
MSNLIEILERESRKLCLPLNKIQLKKFEKYHDFLVEYNKNINLTSITNTRDIALKHFLDSLCVTKAENIKNKVIDVGSGAGFPGIPIKIFLPDIDLSLLDSSGKKVLFVSEILKILNLNGNAIKGRAEEIAKCETYREKFDICVARAVAPMNILSEFCIPLVKLGGKFIAMKGPFFDDELEDSLKTINILGGTLSKVKDFDLPHGVRTILVITKVKQTPKIYPRSNSKIKSSPLRNYLQYSKNRFFVSFSTKHP